jgi:hypothetical protein
MSRSRILAIIVFVAFAVWTAYLCRGYNPITFFNPVFASGPTIQVLTDLAIAQTLILTWMVRDARTTGRKFWPYFLLTFFLGSFGPLLYLILAPNTRQAN